MSDVKPTFASEVQLAGWSESHSGGCKVVLWLADSTDLDAFRAMTVRKGNVAGQRLACVLVEIGDDEKPVEPAEKPREPEPVQAAPLGPLGKWAVMRCEDGLFLRWCKERFDFDGDRWACRALILNACGVDSRKELDTKPGAGAIFKRDFMQPYAAWLKAQGVAA